MLLSILMELLERFLAGRLLALVESEPAPDQFAFRWARSMESLLSDVDRRVARNSAIFRGATYSGGAPLFFTCKDSALHSGGARGAALLWGT